MNPNEQLQIQMMGFIDDELPPEERNDFKEKCYQDPELAAELAKYRRLHEITNSMRLREPEDYEYERFCARLSARLHRRAGWILLVLGIAAVIGSGLFTLFTSELSIHFKVSAAIALTGLGLLVSSVIRVRLRLRRLDRYQGVLR